MQFLCISQPSRTFSFHKHKINTALTEGGSYLGQCQVMHDGMQGIRRRLGKCRLPLGISICGKGKIHTCPHIWQTYVKAISRSLGAMLGGMERGFWREDVGGLERSGQVFLEEGRQAGRAWRDGKDLVQGKGEENMGRNLGAHGTLAEKGWEWAQGLLSLPLPTPYELPQVLSTYLSPFSDLSMSVLS